ncbi:MAG: hypothetical protein AB1728_05530 [Bacteroidota bacterium]
MGRITLSFLPSFSTAQERTQFGTIVTENNPSIPVRIVDKMNQYRSVRNTLFADWNQQEKGMLISTCFGETSHLH